MIHMCAVRRRDSPVSVLVDYNGNAFDGLAPFDEITAGGRDDTPVAQPQTAWQRIADAAWFPHLVLFICQVSAANVFSRLAHSSEGAISRRPLRQNGGDGVSEAQQCNSIHLRLMVVTCQLSVKTSLYSAVSTGRPAARTLEQSDFSR